MRWSIVSDDGHLESGVIAFAVGLWPAPPALALRRPGHGEASSRACSSSPACSARSVSRSSTLVAGRGTGAHRAHPFDCGRARSARRGQEIHRVGLDTQGTALGAGFVRRRRRVARGRRDARPRALRPALVLSVALAVLVFAGHALDPRCPNQCRRRVSARRRGRRLGWRAPRPRGCDSRRRPAGRRGSPVSAVGVVLLGVTGNVRAW